MTRDELRRKLQQARAALSETSRRQAADAVAQRVAQRVTGQQGVAAIFLSFANELDTAPSIAALWQQGIRTVLPVLHPFAKGHLLFLNYQPDTPLVNNRYGIREPRLDCRQVVPLAAINWLFMPLVGFDQQGNRLGMGGGYYDRTLAQWRRGALPRLQPIGLAYDQQRVEAIPTAAWDVPINEVITPSKHWRFK